MPEGANEIRQQERRTLKSSCATVSQSQLDGLLLRPQYRPTADQHIRRPSGLPMATLDAEALRVLNPITAHKVPLPRPSSSSCSVSLPTGDSSSLCRAESRLYLSGVSVWVTARPVRGRTALP